MKIIALIISLMILMLASCKSPFRTYPDEIWPQRVGTYTYSEAITEMGPPNKKADIPNSENFSASWITYRASAGSYTTVLNFNGSGILISWNSIKSH
jgi:hypothetical protein